MINESTDASILESAILSQLARFSGFLAVWFPLAVLSLLVVCAEASSVSRPAAGLDPMFSQELFIERSNQFLEDPEELVSLDAGGDSFLARLSIPPAAKSVGLLILVEKDSDLVENNLSRALQQQLVLDGWPVVLASIESLETMQQPQRGERMQAIASSCREALFKQGQLTLVGVLTDFSSELVRAMAARELTIFEHVVLLGDDASKPLALPAAAILSGLSEQSVGVLDLASQATSKLELARRKQVVKRAGFDRDYRLMLVPQWGGAAQHMFIAKRLRVWLSGINLSSQFASP